VWEARSLEAKDERRAPAPEIELLVKTPGVRLSNVAHHSKEPKPFI
jgi:hypothetical protein